MSKRTRITFETDTLLVVRGPLSPRALCARCASEVEVIALDLVCLASNLTPAELEFGSTLMICTDAAPRMVPHWSV
jgi:hypothetical protein